MTRPLIPFVQNGYYASCNWIPLVRGNGFTTSGGGEQEEVWETVSGSIVTFDAVPAPLRQLSVAVEPVQNLNGYDNPWPAGGGKNLIDYSAFQQYTNWSDSIVTYGDYPTRNDNRGYLLPIVSGVEYTISLGISSSLYPNYCYLCRANGNNVSQLVQMFTAISFHTSSITFTAESGWIYYVRIGSTTSESSFTTQMEKVSSAQLELGSTATAYAPYSNICPITGWNSVTVNRTGVNWYPVSIGADYWTNFNNGSSSNNNGELIVSMAAQMYSGVYSRPDAQIRKLSKYSVTASYSVNIKASVATEIYIGYAQKGNRKVQLTTEYQRFTFENFAFGTDNSFNIYNGTANAVTVYLKDFQFELGSTATAYEPYQGNEYTIQLGETVYGGTLDVVNGKMTVDRAMVTLDGSEEWYADGGSRYRTRQLDALVKSGRTEVLSNIGIFSNIETGVGAIFLYPVNGVGNIYYYPPTSITTVNEFKAWLSTNNMQVVYPLATPFELTLTPEQISTLQGTNNVWADTGDVTVEYRAQ